ncbi:MAG: ABC transporter permease [Bacillota bacterium]|nr:ABC transporter permease [Bacillota bacterium]
MLKTLFWKIKLDFKANFRYKFAFVSDLVVMTVLLLIFLFSNTGKSLGDKYGMESYKSLLLIGYFLWMVSITAISSLAAFLNNQAKIGTLPYLIHSAYPLELIVLGEFISSLLVQSIVIVVISLLAKLIFTIDLYFSLVFLLIIVLCAIGMFGLGLIISGLSLYFKRVGALVLVLQMLLLFITDTIPTSTTILRVSRFIPLTMANDVARLYVSQMAYTSQLLELFVFALVWLALGVFVFRHSLKEAKKSGILLLY